MFCSVFLAYEQLFLNLCWQLYNVFLGLHPYLETTKGGYRLHIVCCALSLDVVLTILMERIHGAQAGLLGALWSRRHGLLVSVSAATNPILTMLKTTKTDSCIRW